jgi:ribosomal protein S4
VARAQTSFGQTLLATLERRLDVAIFRAGFAHSILHARQQIKHGHLSVNGQRARVPSTLLRNGDLFAWNSLDITPSFLARPGHPKASHLEVSHACHSAIFLFTPQNIFLPSFVDPKDLATLASA